ncbi:unnamed protein product [Trypanosoma congolense IL3000]|uniref:AP-3 complex subunit beta n=1 Tax=Trypanosoma congolense (strain IL3000) TaxID=1068625 RepID=F9W3E0_TRYCI|nr:unnamed protein product [Trypanosoma congolense IL3000]
MMNRAVFAEKAVFATERAKEFISNSGALVSRARAFVSSDAQLSAVQPKPEDIRRYLNSDSMYEKSMAMKRIVAHMCKGYDMSCFFADVVKNIHSPSIELRKLIYFYVTHYAGERPNEALLSISAFQKDLMDNSMHVRSLALRMLSSMRISAIQTLVMVAVQKCTTDTEALVRKTAAISLAQLHAVNDDEGNVSTIHSLLQQLLSDKNPDVAAAAASSFVEICPNEVNFIHKVYRNLCGALADCEEWGKVVLMHVLMRYARTQFCDPNNRSSQRRASNATSEKSSSGEAHGKAISDATGANMDSDTSSTTTTSTAYSWNRAITGESEDTANTHTLLDPDHKLLIDSVKPLLRSLNSSVVVGAATLIYHCAPVKDLDACALPLIRLLAGPEERHAVILNIVYAIVILRPEPFVPYVKEFFLQPYDTQQVRTLKLSIIAKLATNENVTDVFREFRHYFRYHRVEKVINAVRGLGLVIVQLASSCASQALQILVPLLAHKNSEVVSEAIKVLQLLVVQGIGNERQTYRLIYYLLRQVIKGEIISTSAKSMILWLAGENIQLHSSIATAAPECFRICVKTFKTEDVEVKKQILMLGCKIWIFLDGSGPLAERFKGLFFYLIDLAKFDDDYEVRDHARLVQCSMDRHSLTFGAFKDMLLSRETCLPRLCDPFAASTQYELGSVSHILGKAFFGYRPLPSWSSVPSDPSLRITAGAAGATEEGSDDDDITSSNDNKSATCSESDASSSNSTSPRGSNDGSGSTASDASGSSRSRSPGSSSYGSSENGGSRSRSVGETAPPQDVALCGNGGASGANMSASPPLPPVAPAGEASRWQTVKVTVRNPVTNPVGRVNRSNDNALVAQEAADPTVDVPAGETGTPGAHETSHMNEESDAPNCCSGSGTGTLPRQKSPEE